MKACQAADLSANGDLQRAIFAGPRSPLLRAQRGVRARQAAHSLHLHEPSQAARL